MSPSQPAGCLAMPGWSTRLLMLLLPISVGSVSSGCHRPAEEAGPIVPGIFALGDVDKLTDAGAQVTRIILEDGYLEDFYAAVDGGTAMADIERYTRLQAIHDAGIELIITVRWPEGDGTDRDRVPTGTDRTKSLELLTRFLTDFGPIMDVYSLQNEVGTSSAPGSYVEAHMTADTSGDIPAIAWWQELHDTAAGLIADTPSLSHLELASPAPTFLKRAALAPDPQTYPVQTEFFYQTLAFAEANGTYLDLHLLNFTLAQMDTALDHVRLHYTGPILVTEWSDVEAVEWWLEEPVDATFRSSHSDALDFDDVDTNRAFVEHTYVQPVTSALWSDYASTIPGEEDFVRGSLEVMEDHGVGYACWALGHQYGEPLYDVKTLYTNLSTGSDDDRHTAVYEAVRSALLEY